VVELTMDRRHFGRTLAGALGALALAPSARAWGGGARPQPSALRVDGDRLNRWLAELRRFGGTAAGGTHRPAYSDADVQARAWVRQVMADAGLSVRVDAAGNLLGRREGRDPSLPPILFGSHIDSVPDGGSYDGNLGSLGAIEVARTLKDRGVTTRHPLEVVVWQNEEGGLVGSRVAAGELPMQELDRVAVSGKKIRDGIALLGGDPARLDSARRAKGSFAAYLELHIEQGGMLEREKVDVGVVEGIVGIWQWTVTVDGFANHAGTTPMDQRRDALLAAAQFVQMVNRVVRAEPGRQVGTVGQMRAEPGAPNVIPGRVVASLELRDLDAPKVRRLYDRIAAEARAIGEASGTTFGFAPITDHGPALTDPRMQRVVADAARMLGLSSRVMPSGAGHDAQEMARLGPAGMIFVPSVGGISHSPRELTKPADCVNGANVLLHAVLAVDAAPPAANQ
jgi:beta-ureidopropionase / N-carbamoyl-L-amino-acid hydrolase